MYVVAVLVQVWISVKRPADLLNSGFHRRRERFPSLAFGPAVANLLALASGSRCPILLTAAFEMGPTVSASVTEYLHVLDHGGNGYQGDCEPGKSVVEIWGAQCWSEKQTGFCCT